MFSSELPTEATTSRNGSRRPFEIDHGPTRNERYEPPPTRMGSQYCAMRYDTTPTTAVARGRPKPTITGTYTPSTTPSPPGVSGTAARTLAKPNATMRPSIGRSPPNARKNTHSAAASMSQLSVAHITSRRSSGRSSDSSCMRPAMWRTASPARSSFMCSLRAIARSNFSERR